MTKFAITLYFAAIVAAPAQASPIEQAINSLPASSQIVIKALSFLPENQRTGILEYLLLIGGESMSGRNADIMDHNMHLIENNPCIANLAAKFYLSINSETVKRAARENQPLHTGGQHAVAMPLSSTVADFGKQPGWLWERALEYSKGDRLLAMQLIGICGHDDVNQLFSGMPYASHDRAAFQRLVPSDQEIQAVALNEARREENQRDTATYVRAIRNSFRFERGAFCPDQNSAFYAPQALGAAADISPSLRSRIAQVQAPTQGASSLPGKNYHVMGSAYGACHLFRRGVPEILSRPLVMGALNAYRSSRICEKLKLDPIVGHESTSVATFRQEIERIRNAGTQAVSDRSVVARESNQRLRPFIEMLLGDDLLDPNLSGEALAQKLRQRLARMDAQTLFRASPQFNASNRCTGPQLGTAVRDFVARNGNLSPIDQRTPCPPNLLHERCQAAREVIETYLVDFEWTESQHLAGYEFAKQNCPQLDPNNTPEMAACRIQNSNPQRSRSPPPAVEQASPAL